MLFISGNELLSKTIPKQVDLDLTLVRNAFFDVSDYLYDFSKWKAVSIGFKNSLEQFSKQNFLIRFQDDGENFTPSLGTPISVAVAGSGWESVAYGNGKFVAVRSGEVYVSSDNGESWTPEPLTGIWRYVAFLNNVFFATGNNVTATSSDGVNWTTVSVTGNFNSATYGDGKFVITATNTIGRSSDNGATWNYETVTPGVWRSVTYGNGKFVVVGNGGRIAYSTDAINWTTILVNSNYFFLNVIYAYNKFIAIRSIGFDSPTGQGDIVFTSQDGENWTPHTADNLYWGRLAFGNGLLIATGSDASNNGIYMISNDGVNWGNPIVVGAGSFTGAAFGDDRFVFTQSTNNFYYLDFISTISSVMTNESVLLPEFFCGNLVIDFLTITDRDNGTFSAKNSDLALIPSLGVETDLPEKPEAEVTGLISPINNSITVDNATNFEPQDFVELFDGVNILDAKRISNIVGNTINLGTPFSVNAENGMIIRFASNKQLLTLRQLKDFKDS
jgi:hypothetical protein